MAPAERIPVGDGVELAYRRWQGPGDPVVLVHGLGGRKEFWEDVAGRLAGAGHDVIAIDMRGAGESEKPSGPYSVEGWAGDLTELVDGIGLARPALVGHSVGCMVVEHAALALGERCTAVAMLGGTISWPEGFEAAAAERAQLSRGGRLREVGEAVAAGGLTQTAHSERPELVQRFLELFSGNDPEAYAESALATARGAMLEPERVASPALALAGDEDAVTPPSAAREIATAMPGGQSEEVPGGAHWCHFERPGPVSDSLLGFLQRAAIG
jgi:3-oxoadipate enol-lactonase